MLALSNPSGAAGIVPWPCVGVLQARTTASERWLPRCPATEYRTFHSGGWDDILICKLNRSNPWT